MRNPSRFEAWKFDDYLTELTEKPGKLEILVDRARRYNGFAMARDILARAQRLSLIDFKDWRYRLKQLELKHERASRYAGRYAAPRRWFRGRKNPSKKKKKQKKWEKARKALIKATRKIRRKAEKRARRAEKKASNALGWVAEEEAIALVDRVDKIHREAFRRARKKLKPLARRESRAFARYQAVSPRRRRRNP